MQLPQVAPPFLACADADDSLLLQCRSNELPILCPVCKAGAAPPCARCSMRKVASGGAPAASWCCRIDSDVWQLLGPPEMEEYLRKSLQVAASAAAQAHVDSKHQLGLFCR